jgi:hypothetical protein
MNILDFENEFETFITFEGDNEQDINDMTIRREQYDQSGAAIIIAEHFSMTTEALEEIALGLQELAHKINDYISERLP